MADRTESSLAGAPIFSCSAQIGMDLTNNAYQHVHHADALRVLEIGRTRWLEHMGYSLEKFLTEGLLLMVTKVEVSYLRELRVGDVTLGIDEFGFGRRDWPVERASRGKEFWLSQWVELPASSPADGGCAERGKIAIEAFITQVFVSQATLRGVAPPADFVEALRGATK